MTPAKLLIAQRLAEHAREGRAIVELMGEHISSPRWADAAADLARGADTAAWFAEEIRAKEGAT